MAEAEETANQGTTNDVANETHPYSSFVLMMDAHNELLQRESKGNDRETYLTAVQDFLKRAGATGAVLQNPDERYTAQSLINYWMTVLYRADIVYTEETTLAAYDAFADVKIEDQRCPYPGVRAFQEDEHKFFFGRQRQINYILSRLREDRLLAIIGPSGSGKTSLVMAGILPEMKQNDGVNNTERHYFPVITPGREPLKALLRMVQQPDGSNQTTEPPSANFQDDGQLLKLINQSTSLPAVIVVDQFHEIFTRANYSDCRAFLRNLEEVIKSTGPSPTVIVMMQEVNYELVLRKPENFRKRLDPAKVSLPSLSSLELRDAIEMPGAYVGMKFPDSLVKALVKETIAEPLGLPLLQFMLHKLWDAHANKEDLQLAFEHMHSSREALAASAEQFFSKLDLKDKATCRRIMEQLIAFDNDSKPRSRQVKRAELYGYGTQARIDNLIARLAQNQLIRLSPGAIPAEDEIELTHDSLLRSWKQLEAWVESLRKYRTRKRVATYALAVLAGIVGLLVIGTLVGFLMEKSKSENLARLSRQELANGHFDLALLLGLSAYQTDSNTVTRGTMLKLLHNFQFTPRPARYLTSENFSPQDLSFSVESDRAPTRLAAIGTDGKIVIWNLNWAHGSPPAHEQIIVDKGSALYPIIFSSDSNIVATASSEPNVQAILWDTTTRQPRTLALPGNGDSEVEDSAIALSTALAFSPDGKLLFAGQGDGKVMQWDLANDATAPTQLYEHTHPIRSFAVDSKGFLLAVGDSDGAVFLLDLKTKRVKKTDLHSGHTTDVDGDEAVYSLSFNQSGNWLAASRASATGDSATVWNVGTGKQERIFHTGLFSGLLVAFSGEELTGFNTKGVVFTWNVARGGIRTDPVYKPLLASTSASFSATGNFVALPSPNGDGAIVWDLSNRRALSRDAVSSIAFKPNEMGTPKSTLLIGTDEGIELLRTNLEENEQVSQRSEQRSVTDVAYSADASTIATARSDGMIRLRNSSDLQERASLSRDLSGTKFTESIARVMFDPVQVNRLAAVVIRTDANHEPEEVTSEIVFWDTTTGSEIQFPGGKPSIDKTFQVTDIAFSFDGKHLVWASTDDVQSKITIWDLAANKAREFPVGAQVFSLALHPKQDIMAVGLADGMVEVWDTDDGEKSYSLKVGSGYVADLAFSPPDGIVLACAINPIGEETGKSNITLWDLTSREQLGDSLKEHDDVISSIAFSPNGNILASGAYDGTVRLWGPFEIGIAAQGFCEIIDCQRTQSKVAANRAANPLGGDWPPQKLYRVVRGYFHQARSAFGW